MSAEKLEMPTWMPRPPEVNQDEYDIVDRFRFLENRPSGNGDTRRLLYCPLCWAELNVNGVRKNVASHIEKHSWTDIEMYQKGYRAIRDDEGQVHYIRPEQIIAEYERLEAAEDKGADDQPDGDATHTDTNLGQFSNSSQ